ncbi:hypothetical protein FA95DRAFT_1596351 [Auriscalpium vulgare]|uniref:Uncharacterized protein n=1 Tax=Auriscalpium vulgare TaxID=40419 RepID=A0ACB8RS38_9AGAM|nr:hypothetical protein FA95DRAFT_1596351 [Auriscalpium vulgare]
MAEVMQELNDPEYLRRLRPAAGFPESAVGIEMLRNALAVSVLSLRFWADRHDSLLLRHAELERMFPTALKAGRREDAVAPFIRADLLRSKSVVEVDEQAPDLPSIATVPLSSYATDSAVEDLDDDEVENTIGEEVDQLEESEADVATASHG